MFWESFIIRNIRILLLTPISLKISSLHMIWKPLNQFCCSLLSNKRFETLFIIRNIRILWLTKFKWFLPTIYSKISSLHTSWKPLKQFCPGTWFQAFVLTTHSKWCSCCKQSQCPSCFFFVQSCDTWFE